jgi:hypothetical protein
MAKTTCRVVHKKKPMNKKSKKPNNKTFVHGLEDVYEKDHIFSQEELAALMTPNDIKRWMCVKAYITAKPGVDDNSTLCRSTLLKFWKKAISFFMPNRLMSWNVLGNVGNPTKSVEINNLIKAVKKKEVRKQSKASSARCPLQHDEYQSMLYCKIIFSPKKSWRR